METSEYQNRLNSLIKYQYELGPFSTIMALISSAGKYSDTLFNNAMNGTPLDDDNSLDKCKMYLGDIIQWAVASASTLNIPIDEILMMNLRKNEVLKKKQIDENRMQAITTINL